MYKVLVVFGTRPEAIKLLPVVAELKKHPDIFETIICVTAQHRELLDQVLNLFEVKPDYDLNIMKKNQSLSALTANIIKKFDTIITKIKPDYLIVQGDTTTTFVASLISFYHKIEIFHIEAGLRTLNRYSPFPEEINRRLTSVLVKHHFAPTAEAKKNLMLENYAEKEITITGNTSIDALFYAIERNKKSNIRIPDIPTNIINNKYVLITGHRRENFGKGFINICKAIRYLAEIYPKINFIYPVHLNPNVIRPVHDLLSDIRNVFLISPLDYQEFVYLMEHAYIILTDSGGIQEEAPSMGKPLLIMRDTTERPEVITERAGILVGTEFNKIVTSVSILLDSKETYNKYAKVRNIYGDGFASKRIVEKIMNFLPK